MDKSSTTFGFVSLIMAGRMKWCCGGADGTVVVTLSWVLFEHAIQSFSTALLGRSHVLFLKLT